MSSRKPVRAMPPRTARALGLLAAAFRIVAVPCTLALKNMNHALMPADALPLRLKLTVMFLAMLAARCGVRPCLRAAWNAASRTLFSTIEL